MSKVAWYDIKGKGALRDIFILLHPPYTLWHLAYVALGASLAPRLNWGLLGWTVLAFFLAMGIGGHFLDELNGRPLKTTVRSSVLWAIAAASILGALAIGFRIGAVETVWVIPCIVFGGFIVFAYNLEWGRGFFHHDFWFAFAWGSFPVITAYVAQTHTITGEAVLMATVALGYSWTQRVLSMHSRIWRRKVSSLSGTYSLEVAPGTIVGKSLTKEQIIGPAEAALKYLNWVVVLLALTLLRLHI